MESVRLKLLEWRMAMIDWLLNLWETLTSGAEEGDANDRAYGTVDPYG